MTCVFSKKTEYLFLQSYLFFDVNHLHILAETDKQPARICIVRKVVVHAWRKLLRL